LQYKNDKISDMTLAPKTSYTDLILGGHTHTFLDKPIELKNALGNQVRINQVGYRGLVLGRIDLVFDKSGSGSPLAFSQSTYNYA